MNKIRRKQLSDEQDLIGSALSLIEEAGTDERNYFEEMPENLQCSERGDRADEVATELEKIFEELTELDDRLSEACE